LGIDVDGRLPAVDETFTIAPRPRSRIPGSTARIARAKLITLSCHISFHCSSVTSSKSVWYATPTLLTRQSTGPSARVASPINCSGAVGSARSQTTPSAAPAPARASLHALGVAAADDDLRALGCEHLGSDEPDSRSSSR